MGSRRPKEAEPKGRSLPFVRLPRGVYLQPQLPLVEEERIDGNRAILIGRNREVGAQARRVGELGKRHGVVARAIVFAI